MLSPAATFAGSTSVLTACYGLGRWAQMDPMCVARMMNIAVMQSAGKGACYRPAFRQLSVTIVGSMPLP